MHESPSLRVVALSAVGLSADVGTDLAALVRASRSLSSLVLLHGVPVPIARESGQVDEPEVVINLLLDGNDAPILLVDHIREDMQLAIDAGAGRYDEYA